MIDHGGHLNACADKVRQSEYTFFVTDDGDAAGRSEPKEGRLFTVNIRLSWPLPMKLFLRTAVNCKINMWPLLA